MWPVNLFIVRELRKLTLDPGKTQEQGNIFVSDIIRKDDVVIPTVGITKELQIYKPLLDMLTDPSRGGYREYQVQGKPERRTTEDCDLSQMPSNRTVFVFPYDWRKSNAESATALKNYIACVQRFYPNSKVDILTHSMGGLVARRYILDNPGMHNVNKLVTIAAPWLGAPKAYFILETGEFVEEVHRLLPFDQEPISATQSAR